MSRTPFDRMACSVARTIDVIGEWWTPLVLRDISLGITRFDAIQRNLGVSRKVLTQRLNRLVEHGVLQRVPYQDNPVRYDYFLTEKGLDLAGVLLALQAWGDRWVFGEEEVPLQVRHTRCGELVKPRLSCSHCGEELRPLELEPQLGPGARPGPGTAEIVATLSRRP